MATYRKRPVEIEAVQHTGQNEDEIKEFMQSETATEYNGDVIIIDTLEGTMRADKNDYTIKGVQGEFCPCKPDIFEATYDLVR